MLGIGLLTVLAIGALIVLIAKRRAFREWRHRPIILRGNHILVLLGVIIVASAYPMTISLIGRHNLNRERDARLVLALSGKTTQTQLDALEARLERDRMAGERKLRQSFSQRISTSLQQIKDCSHSGECKVGFARLIRTVVRVDPQSGDIIPAPPTTQRVPPAIVVPRPTVPPKVVTVPGPAGKDGVNGRDGKDGAAGRSFDSAALDLVDNRLADVERGLASLLGRLPGIDRLLGLLCKALPLVCR